jgi:hypothetical protein
MNRLMGHNMMRRTEIASRGSFWPPEIAVLRWRARFPSPCRIEAAR